MSEPNERFVRQIGPAGPVAVVATVMPVLGLGLMAAAGPLLVPWLRSHGGTGAVVFSAGVALLVGFAVVPTYANAFLAGWTFKFPIGLTAMMAGLCGAAAVNYLVTHRIIGHRVNAAIEQRPRWRIVRDALIGGSAMKVFSIVVLLRISPVLPFSTTNVLLAGAEVRFWPYILGTLIGAAPRQAAVVFIASHAEKFDLDASGGTWMLIASIIGALAVVAVLAVISRHALERATRAESR